MDHIKKQPNIDPDYQSYNTALELNEEEETNTRLKKIRKIIADVYDQEITNKFEQTKRITLQICKVRKLLDLIRNVAIKNYYNKKELEYNGMEEDVNLDLIAAPDKQNRIHPAIKKLLGNSGTNLSNLYLKNKRKRLNTSEIEPEKLSEPPTKIVKTEEEKEVKDMVESTGGVINKEKEIGSDTIKMRNKVKRRIVIGNSSRGISSSENSKLTRKWTVYVQGPKEQEDVSSFIDKVVFYLHPSYKPYDVVEVSRHPIHLQRPGWGEFKIKLEIFFKNKLNKPVTLEHNIKFKDHLFNGRETLGSETLVDLYLYEDSNQNSIIEKSPIGILENNDDINDSLNNFIFSKSILDDYDESINIDEIELKEDILDLNQDLSRNAEHDYCYGNGEENNDFFNSFSIEHDYSLPNTDENSDKPPPQPRKPSIIENIDPNNSLIYGLGQSYIDPPKDYQVNSLQTEKILIPLNELNDFLQVHKKDIKFNNAKIIILNKKIDGLNHFPKLNQINDNKTELKSFNIKIQLPENKFKNVGEALPYLFKRLPLISELANNPIYKRHFPFTAPNFDIYNSWNIGKKRSAEWSLARKIKNLLMTGKVYLAEKWSTKAILMYGRSHCYVPSNNFNLFQRESDEKKLIVNCYNQTNINMQRFNLNNCVAEDDDVDIDVSNIDVKKSPVKNKYSKSVIDISNPELRHQCSYIRETALDCNVVLKSEELSEGIVMNVAERMILEAVKCLANQLIRRAHNYKVCQKKLNNNCLNVDDIQTAIDERPEILTIMQFKNKRRDLERYF